MVGCNRLIAAYMRPHCRIHSFVFESKAIAWIVFSLTGKLCKDNNTTQHNTMFGIYHVRVCVCVCLPMHARPCERSFNQCCSMCACMCLWFCYTITCIYLSIASCMRVFVRVCLVSCRIVNGVQTAVPYMYTHTHTLAEKTDYNSDSSLADSTYRLLLLLLLFSKKKSVSRSISLAYKHTLTHVNTTHGKTIRIYTTIPSNWAIPSATS